MPRTYEQIKQSCLKSGKLYEDPDFEAMDENVFTSRRPKKPFVWLRPAEITNHPVLFEAGASPSDVVQGRLGNCWFLAAVASLTEYPALFIRVVPPDDQSFYEKDYCGAFHFCFWQGGEWVDVIIDDRLPTVRGNLIFLHSQSRDEFWSALLEKAYAKLHGSYEALHLGVTGEAMEDFTGGLTETFNLGSETPAHLFQIMQKAMQRQSLMGCNIKAKPDQVEMRLPNGLVMGHAYTVTGLHRVETSSAEGIVELVRVRNPWGNECEWKGAWSDGSQEWSLLSERGKKEIQREEKFDDDGEFWMSYYDFISNFQRLEICMLGPHTNIKDSKVTWAANMHKDKWRIGCTAGGNRRNTDSFHENPQFRVTLSHADDDDDDDDGSCTLIVSLMQVGRRKLKRKLGEKSNLAIGFVIYKLEEEDLKMARLDKDYFLRHNKPTAHSKSFTKAREITNRFKLKPGSYCIVASTFEPNKEGDFLLRLFSEKEKKSDVQDEQTRMTREMEPITATEEAELDRQYRSVFQRIAGEDEQVDAFQLKIFLEVAFKKELGDQDFNIESCRNLISFYDENRTGKLEYDEFKQALATAKHHHDVFKKYAKEGNGTLDICKLEEVLNALGIKTSKRCLVAITCRYANAKGTVDFSDFMLIYTRVVGLIETFNERTIRGSSKVAFTLDEFIEGAVGF